jgi:hypothetical protein
MSEYQYFEFLGMDQPFSVIEEYLSKCPKAKRRGAGDRLSTTLAEFVPEWSDMISRITKRSPES